MLDKRREWSCSSCCGVHRLNALGPLFEPVTSHAWVAWRAVGPRDLRPHIFDVRVEVYAGGGEVGELEREEGAGMGPSSLSLRVTREPCDAELTV